MGVGLGTAPGRGAAVRTGGTVLEAREPPCGALRGSPAAHVLGGQLGTPVGAGLFKVSVCKQPPELLRDPAAAWQVCR